MGKIKNKRRLHNKAAKAAKTDTPVMEVASPLMEFGKASSLSGASALFKGVRIDPAELRTQLILDNEDAKSTITSKSFKGLGIKKKDKQKMKHELWIQKMDVLNQVKKEAKNKKKRKQTVIVGDLTPLQDTLPTLELLLKKTSQAGLDRGSAVQHPKSVKKMKTRQKELNDSVTLFKQVVQHPSYKANPFATITEHLKNKLKQEEQMDL